jgi:hypothetical protein
VTRLPTGLAENRVSITEGGGDSFRHWVKTSFGAKPAACVMGIEIFPSGVNRSERALNHSSPCRSLRRTGDIPSLSSMSFQAWCLINEAQNTFALPFIQLREKHCIKLLLKF